MKVRVGARSRLLGVPVILTCTADIELLHEICKRANHLTDPPFKALFTSYQQVFAEENINPQHDSVIFRLLLRIGETSRAASTSRGDVDFVGELRRNPYISCRKRQGMITMPKVTVDLTVFLSYSLKIDTRAGMCTRRYKVSEMELGGVFEHIEGETHPLQIISVVNE